MGDNDARRLLDLEEVTQLFLLICLHENELDSDSILDLLQLFEKALAGLTQRVERMVKASRIIDDLDRALLILGATTNILDFEEHD